MNEVADALGVSRQRVAKLRDRPDFPQPIGTVSGRSIWDLGAVEAWAGSGARSGPGRPSDAQRERVLGDRFVLEERIGSGGYAYVYRATDRKELDPSRRAVAVKVQHNLEADAIRRRERELRVLADIAHPNVMSILGRGETSEDGYYYAMPLARGSLLEFADEFLGEDKQQALLNLMRQVCAGLEYVHERDVLHRDLKPGNILRFEAEPMASVPDRWVLADFGLAVEVVRETTTLTATGAGLGTPWYMAPEQWGHARDVDVRADIFSLGRILQELHFGDRSVNLPAGDLRRVILRATAPDPVDRHQSVSDFLADLERALAGVDTSKWESPDEIAQRHLQRLRFQDTTDDELDEVLDWALTLDLADTDEAGALTTVLPGMDETAIKQLYQRRRIEFREAFKTHSRRVGEVRFRFSYCDVLADFARRAVRVTQDPEILRHTITSLTELGHNHGRWFVRGVVTGLLQGLREPEEIFAAINGLEDADREALRWTLTDFSLRSLTPELRGALADLGIEPS